VKEELLPQEENTLGKPEYHSNETNQMLVAFVMLVIQMSGGALACNLQLMHAF